MSHVLEWHLFSHLNLLKKVKVDRTLKSWLCYCISDRLICMFKYSFSLINHLIMQGTGLRLDLTSPFVLLMLFQEDRADWSQRGESRAGLASHGGSKTGGHSHGTRTHQQVLVMGAILGLMVTDEQGWIRKQRGGGDRESRERGRQGYGRSLLINMPDITITLLIQWDTNIDDVRGGEPKQRHKRNREGRGGEGVSRAGEKQMGEDNSHRVPTFSSSSDSRTFQWTSRTQNGHVWQTQTLEASFVIEKW